MHIQVRQNRGLCVDTLSTPRQFTFMKDLPVYLNDHLAGSVGAVEMLDDMIQSHGGKPLEAFLREVRKDIESDQNEPSERHHTPPFHTYHQQHVAVFSIAPVEWMAGSHSPSTAAPD